MQTLHGDAQLQPDSDRASMSTRATGRDSSVDSTAPAAPAPAPAPAREQPVHFYPPQKEYMYADARQPSIRSSRASSRRERRSDPGVDGELFPPDPRPWPTRSLLYQYMPFRGMYHDVKRRLPFYLSDWYIAFLPQNWERVVGATIRMYFLNLMPCLAYIIDMYVRTDGTYGVNEGILSSAIAALAFALFSVQPLTIVGVTGLINLFNYTTYDILDSYDVDYLQFQAWALIWAAIMHWIIAVFNVCDYTRFVTDMTSESFGLYVGVIYVQKGIELLVYEFDTGNGQAGWLACLVAVLFALAVYFIEGTGLQPFGPFWFRKFLIDYSFAAAIIFFTGFVHIPGWIQDSDLEKLPIFATLQPTLDRTWVVPFWDLPVKWVFVALPFGFLVTLLFYFDNNVSSVMAQSRGFPVKRPAGFHWDFFLLGCTTFVAGILGLPAPNGLVPQAPVHTEALSVTELVPEEAPLAEGGFFEGDVKQARREAREQRRLRGEERKPLRVVRTRVVEQRVSHFAMGLLILGTMSRPLLVVLGLMARAMFAGIFLVVGWGSIEGNGIVHKTLYLFRDRRMTPTNHPLYRISKRSIAEFVAIQWIFFAAMIAVSETIAGISFPIFPLALIPVRHFIIPKLFTPEEIAALDAPTANSPAVLVSLGGPLQPERASTRRAARRPSFASGLSTQRSHYDGGGDNNGLRRRPSHGDLPSHDDEEQYFDDEEEAEDEAAEERERRLRQHDVQGGMAGLQRVISIKR
ncbi:hypothetical protein JCM8115_001870 [Rhodotorula mucilaginosa]